MSDKLELKPIPFGSLNTYKASNAIEDSESTIAKNVSIDTVVGEIHPIGPFSQDKYPTEITCIFKWESDYYVQCLNTLFRNKDIIYTLPTNNRLYFLPFTDTFGNNFLLFTDGENSYKYDKLSVHKLGIDGPTNPPVITLNEGVLYRKYIKGIWAGCYASTDRNKYIRNKGFIATGQIVTPFDKDILLNGEKRVYYAMSPINTNGASNVELYTGDSYHDPMVESLTNLQGLPAISKDDGKRDLPLFYLTLSDTDTIDWANIDQITFSFSSNVLFRKQYFRIWLMNTDFNSSAVRASREGVRELADLPEDNAFPLVVCDTDTGTDFTFGLNDITPLCIKKFIVDRELLIGEDNIIVLDLSDLTLEQKQQIKTLALMTFYTQFNTHAGDGLGKVVQISVPDMSINIEYMYADTKSSSGPSVGNLNGKGYSWIYTYLNSNGSESMASPPSQTYELLDQNAQIEVSPSSDQQVVGIKLYRISETKNGFYLVDTLGNNTIPYIDSKKESELGELYNGDYNGTPINGIKGLIHHLNRVFAYRDNYVYYSEANNPEYWGDGISNKIQIGDSNPITGIASFGNFLFVIKEGSMMYMVTPIGIDTFEVKNITIPDGSPYTDAIIGDTGAVYLGASGIYRFASASAEELSLTVRNKFIDGDLTGGFIFRAGNRIICTNPGVVINTLLKVTTEIDIPNLSYATSINGLLYIGMKDGTIYYENENGSFYPFDYTYQTKEFQYNLPLIYKYGRTFLTDVKLESEDAEVTAHFIADGKIKYSKKLIHGKNRFNLPPHYKGLGLQLRFEGKGKAVVKFPGLFLNQLPTDKSKF